MDEASSDNSTTWPQHPGGQWLVPCLFMFPHNPSLVLIPLFSFNLSLRCSPPSNPYPKTPTLPFDLTYMLSPLLLPTLPRPQPSPLISPTCFPLWSHPQAIPFVLCLSSISMLLSVFPVCVVPVILPLIKVLLGSKRQALNFLDIYILVILVSKQFATFLHISLTSDVVYFTQT